MSTQPQPQRETPDQWAQRMIRERGPVPARIGRRLAHLRKQQVNTQPNRRNQP